MLDARRQEIVELNDRYDELIDDIRDPKPEVDISTMPVMAAGVRALDNLRWEYQGALEARELIG